MGGYVGVYNMLEEFASYACQRDGAIIRWIGTAARFVYGNDMADLPVFGNRAGGNGLIKNKL